MSKTELLIQELDGLTTTELDLLLTAIKARRQARLKAAIDEARGRLVGAWGTQDAQEWINQERAADDARNDYRDQRD